MLKRNYLLLVVFVVLCSILFSLAGCSGGTSTPASSSVIQEGNALECYVYVPALAGRADTKDGNHKAVPPGYIALEGATVTVVGTNKSATTDSSGYAKVTDVSSGTYSVIINKEGYQAVTYSNVSVAGTSTTTVGSSQTGVQTQTSSNPAIANLNATSGLVGSSITITGYGFGSTQGASAVTFYNNKTATIINWSSTQIICAVPTGAATGNVKVTVGGNSSNEVAFTVNSVATYTVTYNGNGNTGGSAPVDSNTYQNGTTVTVLGNTGSLVKAGYTFVGWNTASGGGGTDRAASSTFAIGAGNVTLYAKWTNSPTYTVTYNGNGNTGGSVPTDSNNYQNGATVTVCNNTGSLVKAGNTFTGWNTAADGSGTDRAAGSTFAIGAGNVTLYAKWTAGTTYTVTYNGNGNTSGSVPIDSNNYQNDADVTVLDNTGNMVKMQDGISLLFTGLKPVGSPDTTPSWNTAADGSGTNYDVGQVFKINMANVTLYAQWSVLRGTGPAGGLVFYDKGSYSDGWRYMECAPESTEWTSNAWSNVNGLIGASAQGTAIGTGQANTAAIVGQPGHTSSAASLCNNLSYGGYGDWFLPSQLELNQVRLQLSMYSVGGFHGGYYWCSSEYPWLSGGGVGYAYYNNFNSNPEVLYGTYPKSNTNKVRAVREF